MILVIIIGIVVGVAGFLPLWGAVKAAKHITSTSNFSHATTLLVAVIGSVAILFGAAVLCVYLDREQILPFAGGEAAGIIAVAIVFGVRKVILNKKQ